MNLKDKFPLVCYIHTEVKLHVYVLVSYQQYCMFMYKVIIDLSRILPLRVPGPKIICTNLIDFTSSLTIDTCMAAQPHFSKFPCSNMATKKPTK